MRDVSDHGANAQSGCLKTGRNRSQLDELRTPSSGTNPRGLALGRETKCSMSTPHMACMQPSARHVRTGGVKTRLDGSRSTCDTMPA